jgi:CSLREA domain-containing protein
MRLNRRIVIALTAVLAVLVNTPALAETYVVNVMGDEIVGVCDGMHCTLREAIIDANNNPGADLITIPAGEIVLVVDGGGIGTMEDFAATGDLDIRDDVTIVGDGPGSTIVDANRMDRVFHIPVPGLSVSLVGLTITGGGGLSQGGDGGGGIWNEGSDLTVATCDIVDNRTGSLIMVTYYGGGIYSTLGDLLLGWTTVRENRATRAGGIFFDGGQTLDVSSSTIAHNVAVENYGGIYSNTSTATINNSTIAFNSTIQNPGTDVGGVWSSDDMAIVSSTICGNDGHAVFQNRNSDELLTLTNSAVDGPCAGGADAFASNGGNVYATPGHCAVGPGDLDVSRLDLASLGNHGGPTPTMLPYPFSPVIDHAGADAACAGQDQRSIARPQDGDNDGSPHCDAGAVEYFFGEMLFGDNFEAGHALNWSAVVP